MSSANGLQIELLARACKPPANRAIVARYTRKEQTNHVTGESK